MRHQAGRIAVEDVNDKEYNDAKDHSQVLVHHIEHNRVPQVSWKGSTKCRRNVIQFHECRRTSKQSFNEDSNQKERRVPWVNRFQNIITPVGVGCHYRSIAEKVFRSKPEVEGLYFGYHHHRLDIQYERICLFLGMDKEQVSRMGPLSVWRSDECTLLILVAADRK